MEFIRLLDRRFVALAFFGQNMQEHRLLLRLQKFKRADQQRDVVPINRAVIAQAEFLEDDARDKQTFNAFLDLVR